MSPSRLVIPAFLVAFGAIAGCSTGSEGEKKAGVATYESELTLTGTQNLGTIVSGETKTSPYEDPPTYRSYDFEAKGGDEVTFDVRSVGANGGDPMAWITDATYNVLTENDDAKPGTLNALVTYKVPAKLPSQSYRIVFRDFDQLVASFTVKMTTQTFPPTPCSYAGKAYDEGAMFAAADGCNTCTCDAGGVVSCTEIACMCNPAMEPHRDYRWTPQECQRIRYTCGPGQVPFSNSCGCGCEAAPPPPADPPPSPTPDPR